MAGGIERVAAAEEVAVVVVSVAVAAVEVEGEAARNVVCEESVLGLTRCGTLARGREGFSPWPFTKEQS
jgi:hypothetical protein